MKFCMRCGTKIEEGEKFCRSCGARVDDSEQNNTPQNDQQQNYDRSQDRTYSQNPNYYGSSGPKKKSNKNTTLIVVAVVIGLMLISIFLLPSLVNTEQSANYHVEMTVSQVSVNDADNGFAYAYKDDGKIHTYIQYSCNDSASKTEELGWFKTDGTVYMDNNTTRKTFSFDIYSTQSNMKMGIYLLVNTAKPTATAAYDYVDIFDITSQITGEKPTGTHQYGATGVSFYISDLDHDQIQLKGDSQPLGNMVLTFTVTKK